MAGPIRVMVVDDHALVRGAVRQALTTRDVEVVAESSSAEDALPVALDLRPDVLLLDVDLPGVSGLRLLEDLVPRLPDTRIVMLSVSSELTDVVAALRLGAAGYLTKDLDAEALLRAVRGVRQGDLAMPRRLAARAMQELAARTLTPQPLRGDRLESLSEREREIVRLLAEGLTDREIAAVLTISTRTVETHVGNILRKLDVRNRSAAARRYLESG
jgi:two-component system nitrate/nitrite response regulator NarL